MLERWKQRPTSTPSPLRLPRSWMSMDRWMARVDQWLIILEKRIEGLQGSAQIMGITYFHCQEFKSRRLQDTHVYRRTRQQ